MRRTDRTRSARWVGRWNPNPKLNPNPNPNPNPNQASEVYAFGIVAWEVLTAKVPWEGYSLAKLTKAIIKEERPPLPPQGDFQLVKSCWAQEPQPQP